MTESKADSFVADIVEAHANYVNSTKRGFRYALDCGKFLNLAQEDLEQTQGKGKWLAWLKEKTGIPQTTANLYQRLAKHRDMFLDENDQLLETGEVGELAKNGELSLRAAAELLPKTRERKAKAPAAKEIPPEKSANAQDEEREEVSEGTSEEDTALPSVEEISGTVCNSGLSPDDLFKVATEIIKHVLADEKTTQLQLIIYQKAIAAVWPTKPELQMAG